MRCKSKISKMRFLEKNCRIDWIFRSELRVATHIYKKSVLSDFPGDLSEDRSRVIGTENTSDRN